MRISVCTFLCAFLCACVILSAYICACICLPAVCLCVCVDEWTSDTSLITQREENINMVATVLSFGDVPLKLFVDRCVVTEHDDLSMPVHDFINNHGSDTFTVMFV